MHFAKWDWGFESFLSKRHEETEEMGTQRNMFRYDHVGFWYVSYELAQQ